MTQLPRAETPSFASRHRKLELGLWIFGAVCLLWALVGWGAAAWYQHRADEELALLEGSTFDEAPRGEVPIPREALPGEAAPAAGSADPSVASSTPGTGDRFVSGDPASPLGRIVVPAVGVRAVIASGVEETTLRKAVGWLPSSAPPGSSNGNVALAGHRDTFFRDLEGIRLGDEILVETPSGSSSYRVEWIRVVEPDHMEVVAPTDHPAVTLVTCYPFRWIGPAPKRFVVRARATADGGGVPGP